MGKMMFIVIVLFIAEFTFVCLADNFIDCIPSEKKALVRFTESLSRPSNMLSSWTNNDCCTWQGVECDEATGHVNELRLGNTNRRNDSMLQGYLIDSSLLELKHLNHLDLSFNDFQGSPIPTSFGSMKQLQYLNLSNANFVGIVPHQLGSLSSLRTLDLGGGSYGNLIVDDFKWAVNLISLEYLDLSYVNLSGTQDLAKVLSMFPSMIELRLSRSGLDNTNLAHACVNSEMLINVQHLDLSSNSFEGNCPCFIQNMTSLSFLDISDNRYNSCDPRFIKSTNLDHLNLANNSLRHNADWVYEVFYGDISGAFRNLSRCWSDNLESLDLGLNQFHGHFPEGLVSFSALRVLNLSQNQLTGEIPVSLGQLSNLENNMLRFSVGDDWVPPFQLKYLSMRATEIGGRFPQWLEKQKAIYEIVLSNCRIIGTLPKWLRYSVNLTYLHLSNNLIEMPIPELAYSLESLHLNNNNLTGQLPTTLQSCRRLKVVDVGDNKLSGELPEWIGNYLADLQILRVKNNEFYGSIPMAYCLLYRHQMMDLANNNLTGSIPNCFSNFSGIVMLDYTKTSVVNLDLSCNHLAGEIPSELTNLAGLIGLNLSHNHLGGNIPGKIGDMKSMESLDISSNNLSGTIPESLLKLTSLSHLNLSHNNLSGRILTGSGLWRFVDPMIYDGNSGLCGAPLLTKCPPKTENDAEGDGDKGKKKHVKIIILGVLSAMVLLSLAMALFITRKLKQGKREATLNELLRLEGYTEEDGGGSKSNDLRLFTYSSIQSATHNFSSKYKLGQGGFGPVYKGKTSEGQDVAVKLLSRQSGQGLLEFKTELMLISKLQHVNLVKLIGFCVHRGDKMIIYDYMPNKSLDFFLFSSSMKEQLDWQKRFNIIEGIAQGLLYLHKYSRLKIIHRDLKPSNILLDQNMNPKISDFGLARIFKQDISEDNTKRRVGTFGYMAPEYAMQGIFSVKSDVYSFGVLILEIVSGRKNNSFHEIEGPLSLMEYAWELWRKGYVLELMDSTLRDSCVVDQLQRCIHIGLLCVENHVSDRPTIEDVILMLKNEMTNWPMPESPAFITRYNVIKEVEKSAIGKLSANELTLSEMGGR
ncbi:hypothetical protein CASFOL_020332 [Castilleja foliolosa]|uniref:non-specific serine/threonine protein kinase n=1 Tax=Castilleja foliolosa TaxID=1961234 RepID=A0ABD3D495_9LAMI